MRGLQYQANIFLIYYRKFRNRRVRNRRSCSGHDADVGRFLFRAVCDHDEEEFSLHGESQSTGGPTAPVRALVGLGNPGSEIYLIL